MPPSQTILINNPIQNSSMEVTTFKKDIFWSISSFFIQIYLIFNLLVVLSFLPQYVGLFGEDSYIMGLLLSRIGLEFTSINRIVAFVVFIFAFIFRKKYKGSIWMITPFLFYIISFLSQLFFNYRASSYGEYSLALRGEFYILCLGILLALITLIRIFLVRHTYIKEVKKHKEHKEPKPLKNHTKLVFITTFVVMMIMHIGIFYVSSRATGSSSGAFWIGASIFSLVPSCIFSLIAYIVYRFKTRVRKVS